MTVAPSRYQVVDLTGHFDTVGITTGPLPGAGFNIWGNTFPAGDLPAAGLTSVADVPFQFPDSTAAVPDNLRCDQQLVAVPPGRYDWLHVLAAAERRSEDLLALHFADGAVDHEWLRVADFWPGAGDHFGGRLAFRATGMHYPRHHQPDMRPAIWRHRVPVPREADLVAVRLPENPAIHLFAVTAQRSAAQPAATPPAATPPAATQSAAAQPTVTGGER